MAVRSAPVAMALIGTNVVVFILEHVGIAEGRDLCAAYGLVPSRLEPASLVTSMFLHDPSTLIHVVGNMAFLAVFGSRVEMSLGHARFGLLYFTAGVGGGLMHVLVDPGATASMVGASGALWGVLAAAAMLYGEATLVFVAIYFTENLWYAFTGTGGTVAFGAHIGGFVVGFLLLWLGFAGPYGNTGPEPSAP